MLKDECELMLLSLINNKKALRKFYKTGYSSYSSNDESFKGAATIVEGDTIMSFMQDVNDESKVIATATYRDTTIIIQLNEEEFLRTQLGGAPCGMKSTRESAIGNISSVKRHCAEAEEKLKSEKFIRKMFSKSSNLSDKKISKKDVRIMLETTFDKLKKTLNLNNRNQVSPKVNTGRINGPIETARATVDTGKDREN